MEICTFAAKEILMMVNMLRFIIVVLLWAVLFPVLTYAENIFGYEKYKQESLSCFQEKNYEQAYLYLYIADSIRQIEHQNKIEQLQQQYFYLQKQVEEESNISNSSFIKSERVTSGIFIFILIDVLGLLFFMYLQKQRTYMHLVKKNMEWAQTNTLQPAITIEEQRQDETEINPPVHSPEDSDSISYREKSVLLRCIQLFKDEKVYLNADINLQDMATLLDTNKNTLSKAINAHFHKNFPSLVTEYRVKEAINLLSNTKQLSVYTLEAIGEKCGFRSRQAFHLAFKRATGITPSDFRNMLHSRDFRDEYGDPSEN
jgi:AraC-like DNA-binding protein